MRDLATNIHGAWLLVGDFNLLRCAFNLLRCASDKNTHHFNSSLADSFNTCINSLALLELPLLDRLYTWSNKRSSPTLTRLDRAFLNMDFSCLFLDCTLTSRIRSTSDHVPLLLTLYTDIPRSSIFRFENARLKHPLFLDSTLPAWSAAQHRDDAARTLVARVKAYRQEVKVWKKKTQNPSLHLL